MYSGKGLRRNESSFLHSPFLLCFTLLSFGSGFRVQGSGVRVQGSGFKVQGSGFKVEVAASPLFLDDGILVSQPSPLGEGARKGRIG